MSRKARDIHNDTDPQELKNLLHRLRAGQNDITRATASVIINQAPAQYPSSAGNFVPLAGHDPNCVVITDSSGVVTTDPSLEYVTQGFVLGAQRSTSTVNGTSSAGTQITGLVIGQWYAVEGTGGPWHMHTSLPLYSGDFYNFQLSLDGVTFSGEIGYNNYYAELRLILPSFCDHAEAVDAHYGRVYFQATTTSIWFRCVDDTFGDNSGTMGYKLLDVTYGEKEITLDDVEYTKAKIGGAIHSSTEKTSLDNADEFGIWDSLTYLFKRVTWSTIKSTLKTYFDTLYASFNDAEGNPSDPASSASDGTSTYAARRDHVHRGVKSISKSGSSALYGDVTISQGASITITQSGQNIEIAAAVNAVGELLVDDAGNILFDDNYDVLYEDL